jgi:alpha-tubulin suppressor-like RCC1 family protein
LTGGRRVTAGAIAGLALAATACMDGGDFRCTEHAQCAVGSVAGFCEANGHCSVPADGCATSQRRYVHRAGADSDLCVPAACDGRAVAQVSAGGGHACLVRDHMLWCWGRNDRGQLGDGTRTPRALPIRITGVSDVAAVAAGDAHTCAAQTAAAGGAVWCWGADDAGQLGDGGGDDRGLPRLVDGVRNAKALAAGRDFSCAVGSDGNVLCWGSDRAGQLGDGVADTVARPPSAVAGVTGVTAIAASWQHVCALVAGGKVTCWGDNAQGQIGDGVAGGIRPPTTPAPAALPPSATAVATGREHTCALAGGNLLCWGGNSQAQVDPSQPSASVPSPSPVVGAIAADPIAVAAGAQHTCIVQGGGNNPIVCWGANGSGQLGGGTAIDNATAVVAGATFTCGVAADGAIFCWGDNHYGQLAIGGGTVRTTPVQVPMLAGAGALAAGGAHTCAAADVPGGVRATYCWGSNESGELGIGSSNDDSAIGLVSQLQATVLAAGGAHTCATARDEQLRCWGRGDSGQLLTDPGTDGVIATPALVDLVAPAGGDGVFAIAAGAAHTCVAATISASLLCFGRNGDGQLGGGFRSPTSGSAVAAPLGTATPLPRPVAVAAGDAHTCAVDDGGAVWCWGANTSGQLGNGSVLEQLQPTSIALGPGVPDAEAVAAGAEHTCVLAGGRIFCWGRNAEGQVGNPVQMPMLSPQEVTAFPEARAVAAGGRHTCAIAADATVGCWGANDSGQLGNGGTDSSNVPVPVSGLTGVDALALGAAHSCARRSDGTVWCWGANTSGQLGDGVTLSSDRPLLARISCQ